MMKRSVTNNHRRYGLIPTIIQLLALSLQWSAKATHATITPDSSSNQETKKKLKVFIMMGQSNMIGYGQIAPESTPGTLLNLVSKQGKYHHLLNDTNNNISNNAMNNTTDSTKLGEEQGSLLWSVRNDVRVVYRQGSGEDVKEDDALDLTVDLMKTGNIGPELQFGHVVGDAIEEPVLLLKLEVGNRALGWDFLPPSSKRYKHRTRRGENSGQVRSYPAYGECPEASLASHIEATEEDCNTCKTKPRDCPVSWPNKTQCSRCFGWYAGIQFDRDLQYSEAALKNLPHSYPDYDGQGFEIAGFVFWQGNRDTLYEGHARRYKRNLQRYIRKIRQAYAKYPGQKKFVLATIGFGGCNSDNVDAVEGYNRLENIVYKAQRKKKWTDRRRVKTIDARPYWRDSSISPQNVRSHYNHNAETIMEVGNALGLAMVDLLFGTNEFVEKRCKN